MQNLKDLTKKESQNKNLEIEFDKSMQDKVFCGLVSKLKQPKKELMKYTTKLNNTCTELGNCKNCKGLFECKNSLEGHVSAPKVIQNKIYFTYFPCKYLKTLESKETEDKKLLKITMKDIDTKDKKQLQVIKWMDDFYSNFDLSKNTKGLYLHGSFGSGKTFLLTALINELEKSKGASTLIVYFPDALRELKEDFESMPYKMHEFMNVDILLIDDIGAEKVTEWGRDEILGTILQNRMNNHKTTFFTSNLTINELESHLSLSSNGVDKVKARRIIERIKQLTTDLELVSENRRK
jgi:primosomal protein DnaI